MVNEDSTIITRTSWHVDALSFSNSMKTLLVLSQFIKEKYFNTSILFWGLTLYIKERLLSLACSTFKLPCTKIKFLEKMWKWKCFKIRSDSRVRLDIELRVRGVCFDVLPNTGLVHFLRDIYLREFFLLHWNFHNIAIGHRYLDAGIRVPKNKLINIIVN